MRALRSLRQRPRVESLEARVLYSADPASAVFDAMPGVSTVERRVIDAPRQQACVATSDSTTQTRHELVLVDTRVATWQQLVDDIPRGSGRNVEVVLLDPARDGIGQISERLAREQGLDAVHIVSHGEAGALQIGATRVDFDTLLADASAVSRWRLALNSGADLMLYGCDLAASEDGRALVDAFSRLTGADVAASVDTTGNAKAGGDWVLEYATGSIESTALAGAAGLAAWDGSLGFTFAPSGAITRANQTTTGTQSTEESVRQVGIDGAGNFIVVWNDANTGDVYGRRFNAAGTALGNEFRINTTTAGTQNRATVAMNASGAFVVAWQSADQDGGGLGVYARRYDAAGVAQSGEILINQQTLETQEEPAVAMDSSGNFVVAWSNYQATATGYDVYARRFDAAGNALGNESIVNAATAGWQGSASIAMTAGGDYVIAWGDPQEIVGQRFNSAGVAQGGNFLVNTTTAYVQASPSIAVAANGDFVVTWFSSPDGSSNYDCMAQRYDASGVAQGGEILVNATTSGYQYGSSVTMDSQGNFLVAWHGGGSGLSTYGRLFDSTGAALTGEVVMTTGTQQQCPSVAWNGKQAVIAWCGDGTGDTFGVFFKTFNATVPGVIVTPATSLTTTEALASTSFNVVLNTQPIANVTISIASSDTTEGTVSTSSLTFTTANWNVPRTVTITGVNDAVDDGDVSYSIVTGAAVSTDTDYSGMVVDDVSVANLDNDTAGITVTPISANGTETRVNVTTTGTQSTHQGVRQVAVDATGNFVVVWNDPANSGDVYGRRFDSAGNALGSEFRINTTTSNTQDRVTVAMNAPGAFIVVWQGTNQDGSGLGVYAQRYDASGAAQGGEFRINQQTSNDQGKPSLAIDSAGNFIVTWTSDGQDGNGYGVYARRFDSAGNALGNEFRVNTTTSGDQQHSSVALDDSGGFVIIWQGQDGGGFGSYGQRFNGAGVAQGSEFRVNTTTDGDQDYPSIAMAANGDFVVAWSSQNQDGGGWGTYAQRYSAAGVAQGGEFLVNTTTSGDQDFPTVAMDSGGNFLVSWESQNQDSSGSWGVYGRLYDKTGTALSGEMLINTTTSGTQDFPSVAWNGSQAVYVWEGNGTGDSTGIFFQRVNTTGPGITTEAGGTATFSVVLDSQPAADVTISITSGDTTEGTVSASSLTFTAANWNVPRTVTVTGVNDDVDDGDVSYLITGATASTDANYSGMPVAAVSMTNVDNDTAAAGITVMPISGNTTEAGTSATFSVVLTSQPTADVTISLASDDTTEGTVSTPSLTFTAANWNVAQMVTVSGVNDAVDDGDVSYSIVTSAAVSADGNYGGRDAADVAVVNVNDDTAGITVSPISGNTTEAGGTATFNVVLNSQPTNDVTIAIVSGDPTEGTTSASSITFTAANWNIAQVVTVTGANDPDDDGNVGFSMVTDPATSSDVAYNGLDAADVAVTNVDDDTAGISVTPITGLQTTESGATADFSVVLTSRPAGDVTIMVASSDTTEGTVSVSSLTFSSANWNVAQVVTVTGVDDAIDDGDVGYTIVNDTASSADAGYNGMSVADVSVINVDGDSAGIVVSPISGNTTEAGGSATFGVVLATQPTGDVMISIASSNPSEGTPSVASLVFSASNWNIAQVVTVTGVNDAVDDGDVGYNIVTDAAVSSDAGYNGLNASDVGVANLDDDTAGITVAPLAGSTTEAGGMANFSVVLNSRPTSDVTIAIASSDATEGTASATSLTFTAANWNVAQVVIVTGVDDAIDDGDSVYSITTGAATSADAKYAGLGAGDVVVTNLDDDAAGITVSAISGRTTEAGGTATFTIVLASQPTADVTIELASSDSTEGTVSMSSVVFTAADWNVAQTVTVTGVDDAVDGGDAAFAVVTGPVTSGDGAYNGLTVGDVAVTNVDDDTAGVTVSGISGNTTEAGGTATFNVVLDSQPTADVTISIASSNAAEGTTSTPSLTFTAANWNVAQVVTVVGVNDAVSDGNVAYTVVTGVAASTDVGYDGIAAGDVAVINLDDETAPALALPGSIQVDEDTPVRLGDAGLGVADANGDLARIDLAVAHGALDLNLAGGASIVAASPDHRSISLAGTHAQLVDALARITYRGDADWSGTDTLAVSAVDASGLQAGGSVSIQLSPVNDAPVITSVNHVEIAEGLAQVTRVTSTDVEADVPHYAITGGADAAQFVIDSISGELRLRSAADAEAPVDSDHDNVYEVTVEVSDGQGGTARQSLDVSVVGVNEAPSVSVSGLSVPAGGAVALSQRQIVADDVDSPTSALTFSVSGVVNGHFELADQRGTAIASFSEAALESGLVTFVHDPGMPPPQFLITVSDGQANSAPLLVRATLSSSEPAPADSGGNNAATPPEQATAPAPTNPARAEPASTPSVSELHSPSRVEAPSAPRWSSQIDESTASTRTIDSAPKAYTFQLPSAASRSSEIDETAWHGDDPRRAFLLAIGYGADSRASKESEESDRPRLGLASDQDSDPVHLALGGIVLQTLGIALTAGSVWWALRATGLVTALLASLPAWRQFDFLPVLADEEDEDTPGWSPAEDAEAARDEAAVGRDLFVEGVLR